MTRNHIDKALSNLKSQRKIFHSEADFQFAFAWELQKLLPNANIRLEYCPSFAPTMHIDIYVVDNEGTHPIELKYKTKSITTTHDNEYYKIKNHGAQDLGRFDFLYDINRIESVKKLDSTFKSGYAIMITNDPSYWKAPCTINTVDSAFRIHDGQTISGLLEWGDKASKGTTKGRDPFELKKQYNMHWETFSQLDISNGLFMMNVVEVS